VDTWGCGMQNVISVGNRIFRFEIRFWECLEPGELLKVITIRLGDQERLLIEYETKFWEMFQ